MSILWKYSRLIQLQFNGWVCWYNDDDTAVMIMMMVMVIVMVLLCKQIVVSVIKTWK